MAEEPKAGRWSKPPAAIPRPSALHAVVGGLALFLYIASTEAGMSYLIVPSLLGLVAVVVLGARRENPMLGITDEDRRLLEDPDDRDVCLVRLTVFRDGKAVGRDKGVVWFEGNRLFYNGHRTSFVIGGQDVLPRELWPVVRRDGETSELNDLVVPLAIGKGSARIELRPLAGHSVGSPAEMRFLKRLYEFRRSPAPAVGERQWPPFEEP